MIPTAANTVPAWRGDFVVSSPFLSDEMSSKPLLITTYLLSK
jgi:hypothetical protein